MLRTKAMLADFFTNIIDVWLSREEGLKSSHPICYQLVLTPELSTRQKSIQSLSHLQSETIFYHHKYFMETNFWEKEVSWNDMNKETGEILVSPVNSGYQFHNNDSNV